MTLLIGLGRRNCRAIGIAWRGFSQMFIGRSVLVLGVFHSLECSVGAHLHQDPTLEAVAPSPGIGRELDP